MRSLLSLCVPLYLSISLTFNLPLSLSPYLSFSLSSSLSVSITFNLSSSLSLSLFTSLLHFLRLIPGRGRRSVSVVSKSFCRMHLLAPPAVPACPGSQDRAISLWVCLLVAFRGSPCPSLF